MVVESAMSSALDEFVYSVPHEKFVYQIDGLWRIDTPVGKEGIRQFLLARNTPLEVAEDVIGKGDYRRVLGTEIVPNAPPVCQTKGGNHVLNLWVKPELEPASMPGPFPRIVSILRWLCGHDDDGAEWLFFWIARKIQNPALLPRVAVLFGTGQGAGKGTLFRILQEILGRHNTAQIKRANLESRFNGHWGSKLLVLADEVVSSDNSRDVSEDLKIWIDSPTIQIEHKNVNAFTVENRLAWIFASNDTINPLKLDPDDRRYTIFNNFDPVTPEHRDLVRSCFDATGSTFTETFKAEIRNFWHELLTLPVDVGLVSVPYRNAARATLIEAGKAAHETFLDEVTAEGIDPWLEAAKAGPDGFHLNKTIDDWDFGDDGVATTAIYAAFVAYCEATGRRPIALNRFGTALANRRPALSPFRVQTGKNRRVRGYVVKRNKSELSIAAPSAPRAVIA